MPSHLRRSRAGHTPSHPYRPRPRRAALGAASGQKPAALLALLALLALPGLAPPLAAQDTTVGRTLPLRTGSIAGTVLDEGGIPVAGAQVQVIGLVGRGASGTDGGFVLAGIPTGGRVLHVRRLGFGPESVSVEVAPGAETRVEVRLSAVPQRIDAVVVEASRRPVYTGRLARFWERRERGNGRFFTAEEIDRRNPVNVTDLLRTVPGVQVVRRGLEQRVFFRNQRCAPLVWIDGMPASAGYLDVDTFRPNSLAGIEVYSGPAQVPAELMWVRGAGACGVIALWTRLDDPPGKRPQPKVTATELANLVNSLRLYTSEQVDEPAMPDTAAPVAPTYPDSLLRAGVSGRVLVEFVVDTTGEVDMSTFGAVLSSDQLFTDAVRRAVSNARSTPATVAGRRVRQLVQLPFRFVAPERGGDEE